MPTAEDPNLSNDIDLAPGVTAPASMLRFSYTRSSGPGGQNVNKLATKARLHVALADLASVTSDAVVKRLAALPGVTINRDDELVIACDTSRSQSANRRECVARLRALVVQAMVVPKTRKRRRPSAAMKRRRLEAKRKRAETKRLRRKPSRQE